MRAAVGRSQVGVRKAQHGGRPAKVATVMRMRGPQVRAMCRARPYTSLPASTWTRFAFERAFIAWELLSFALENGLARLAGFVYAEPERMGDDAARLVDALYVSTIDPLFDMYPGDLCVAHGQIHLVSSRDEHGDRIFPAGCRQLNRGPGACTRALPSAPLSPPHLYRLPSLRGAGARASHFPYHLLAALKAGVPLPSTDKIETNNNQRRQRVRAQSSAIAPLSGRRPRRSPLVALPRAALAPPARGGDFAEPAPRSAAPRAHLARGQVAPGTAGRAARRRRSSAAQEAFCQWKRALLARRRRD